jgi:two-component system, response regulator
MVDQLVDILVVEDDPGDLELMLHAFKANRLFNPVQIARDGEEALDYIASDAAVARLGLILLDLKLPRVDGLEVLRHLKCNERTKHVPVVVLTSSSEESDLVESYSHGVNSYIQKPVDFDKFTEVVRSLGMYWLLLNRPLAGVG